MVVTPPLEASWWREGPEGQESDDPETTEEEGGEEEEMELVVQVRCRDIGGGNLWAGVSDMWCFLVFL